METEWLIQQALAALMVGRTTVIIAQRLRTLKQADTILVLERGHIVQRGTHDDLVEQEGLYRRIYDVQLRDQEVFLGQAETRADCHVPQVLTGESRAGEVS
jgi:ATP-binding cassette subfamily B protein